MAPPPFRGPSRTPHFPVETVPPAPRFAYDDAVRADQGPPPSASWSTDPFGYGAAGFSVTSGLFTPAAGTDHEMKWLPDFGFGPYLSLAIDVPVLPLTGETVGLSVMQTWALASFTGYQLKFVAPSTFTLYRDDTAAATTLTTGSGTLLAGDTLNIRITPTTVEAWVGSGGVWTMVLQSSDTTYRSSAFGVGVYVQNTTARLNNFLVENAAVAFAIQNQTVSPPAATASASAPTPAINVSVTALLATASASAPVPVPQLQVSPAAATASASAPVPTPQLLVTAPVATASASAPAPVMPIVVPVATASANSPPAVPQLLVTAPAATASASAPLPTPKLQVAPAAATASASAPTPTVALQVSPAAATASASAPLPTLKLQVAPAAATASASSPAPVLPIVVPAATASASAPTPTVQDRVSPGTDTATGSAPTPGVDVKLSPAAATASASAPVPVVSAGATVFPPVATASASASSLTDWTPTTGAWLLSNVNLTGSDADWATREAALGRTFSGRMKYKTITTTTLSDLNVGDLFASVAYPTAGGLSFSGNNTIPSINAGSQDANLIAFANAVKAIAPTRVFLRLFWEFNLAGNRFNPANYVDSGGVAAPGAWSDFQSAWVRVWTIFFGTAGDFTAQGISGTPPACSHDQVKFAYNPNKKGGSSPVDPTLGYPGSQYVDWIFLDSYPNRVSGANEVLDSPTILVTKPSVSGAVDWYNTFSSYGKPLGIGETSVHPVDDSTTIYGSGNGVSPVTRSQWWSLWVPALQAFPLIRLVTFFDANDATWPGSGHTWQTDAASATTGDSGSQAFTAYSTFANDAYVKPLASAGLGVTVPPAAATASASAPVPTVTAASGNQTVSPPAATATATAPTPTPALKVPPAAATASASAPTPTISVALTVAAPVATASAASPAPTLALRLSPPAAAAAASGIGPADIDAIPAPAATASASAPAPTLSIPIGGFVSVPVIFAIASAPTPKIHHIFFDIAELWHHHENGLGEYPIAPGLSLNTAELFNQRYRDNSKAFPVTGDPSLTVDLEKLWDQKYRDTSVPFPVDQL